MEKGASAHWQDTLEEFTGSRVMDVQPLIEYFQPLFDWLALENEGEDVGWADQCPEGVIVP